MRLRVQPDPHSLPSFFGEEGIPYDFAMTLPAAEPREDLLERFRRGILDHFGLRSAAVPNHNGRFGQKEFVSR